MCSDGCYNLIFPINIDHIAAITNRCDYLACSVRKPPQKTIILISKFFICRYVGLSHCINPCFAYDTGIDINKLLTIIKHFKTVEKRLKDDKILNEKSKGIDVNTLLYQVPGGMLSNLINQLEKAGKADKLMECLAEVPNVRKDCGYPPLVTPSSQIVGTQAVMNVVMGQRYKMVTKETKDLFAGKYGTLPMPLNEEVAEVVLKGAERITCRPADLLKPEYEEIKQKLVELGYYEKEEDVLSYAVFEQVAENFFKWRTAQKQGVDKNMIGGGVYPV